MFPSGWWAFGWDPSTGLAPPTGQQGPWLPKSGGWTAPSDATWVSPAYFSGPMIYGICLRFGIPIAVAAKAGWSFWFKQTVGTPAWDANGTVIWSGSAA